MARLFQFSIRGLLWANSPSSVMVPIPNFVPLNTYTSIFHALCLLLAAAVGGKTCQVAYRTKNPAEE